MTNTQDSPAIAGPLEPSVGRLVDALRPVAALYVETDGAYFGVPSVVAWDEPKDARLIDAAIVVHAAVG